MTIYYPKAHANIAFVPFDEVVRADNLIRLSGVPPRMMRVENNDIFTADRFSLELDERYFRLDPRDVRCISVDLHMGNAASANAPLATGAATRLLLGHTDKIQQRYDTTSASIFTCEGRDYTGLALDEKWQGRRLKLGRPLSELIREAIDTAPALAPLQIALGEGATDPIIPAGRRRKGRYYQAQPDKTLWEALLALAMRGGVLLTIQLDQIVIQPPRNVLSDGAQAKTPLFVEGRNVKHLTVERTLGRTDLPNVQVTAMDPATGRLVTGQWPLQAKRKPTVRATKTKARRTKKTTNVEIRKYTIRHPAPTSDLLSKVARGIFEYYSQQQIKISFATSDLAVSAEPLPDEGGVSRLALPGAAVPATSIRNGSAVRLRIDQNARTVLSKAVTVEQKRRELVAMQYNEQVARVMARGWRTLDQLLFVGRATHQHDSSGAYSLEVEAMNFITLPTPGVGT